MYCTGYGISYRICLKEWREVEITHWIKRYFVPRASTVVINYTVNCRNKIN